MITDYDLSSYLENLPKDLEICVGEKKYPVSRQLFSALSGFIQSHEGPSVKIPFDDGHNVFHLAIDFVYAKKIDINPSNDKYLVDLSTILEIPSLKEAAEPSLLQHLSADNIVYRIVQRLPSPYEDLYPFLTSNIEKVVDSSSFAILPTDVALRTFKDSGSSFANNDSRIRFALRFCSTHLDTTSMFFDSNFVFSHTMLREIGEKYSCLDGHLPSFSILKGLLSKEYELNTKIQSEKEEIGRLEEEIKSKAAESEEAKSQLRTLEEKAQKAAAHQKLLVDHLDDLEAVLNNALKSLENALIRKEDKIAISNTLSECSSIATEVLKRTHGGATEEFANQIKNALVYVGQLKPNEEDIVHLKAALVQIISDIEAAKTELSSGGIVKIL